VGIIDHGRVVTEGTPQQLVEKMGADSIRISGKGNGEAFKKELESKPFVQNVVNTDGLIQIGVDSGNKRLAEVVATAGQSRFTIEDISIAKPGLGDVFLKYTGRQLRDK
jgi:ABC-2 type transport system ATP-binding protein